MDIYWNNHGNQGGLFSASDDVIIDQCSYYEKNLDAILIQHSCI